MVNYQGSFRHPESYYRNVLAKELNGEIEVATPVGRIDVLTDSEVIEVKTVERWKEAIGQVLAYGYFYPLHKKRIHFIQEPSQTILEICKYNQISVSWHKNIEVVIKTATTSIEDLTKEANAELKKRKSRLFISICKNYVYLRGKLPPDPGSNHTEPHQQRIPMGGKATPALIREAANLALAISQNLNSNLSLYQRDLVLPPNVTPKKVQGQEDSLNDKLRAYYKGKAKARQQLE